VTVKTVENHYRCQFFYSRYRQYGRAQHDDLANRFFASAAKF
jgi:hypothetical protein